MNRFCTRCNVITKIIIRHWLSVGLGVIVLLLPVFVSAQGQQPKKVPRIGFLTAGDAARQSTPSEAIRLALSELGYIEGQNIAVEYRYAEGKRDRYAELAAELVHLKVDIIVVTGGNVLVRAAKDATKIIPIVFVGAADPVAWGLVASLAHPGGNVTGLSELAGRELEGKRLEILKEAFPRISRVAVVLDSTGRVDPRPLRDAARALGLTDRGVLRVGARADLAIWRLRHPEQLCAELGVHRPQEIVRGA